MTGAAGASDRPGVSLRAATRVWWRVALLSFGGPTGQIAVMHRLLVEEHRWIGDQRFLHALNYVMLLPGPEAQQLASYIGWLLHGTRGALVAGGLFILPGFVSILLLSILYARFGHLGVVTGLFYGLKPAVIAIVALAVVRLGRRALAGPLERGIAVLAFVAMFVLEVPFPLVILSAGLIGLLVLGSARSGRPEPAGAHPMRGSAPAPPPSEQRGQVATTSGDPGRRPPSNRPLFPDDAPLTAVRPSLPGTARQALVWLGIWLLPLLVIVVWLGPQHVLASLGIFFSKVAVVTFGGAYAVLAYVAQQAVDLHGWLAPGEMLDGLGMAETTPGPLIQVVQFVGFLGAFRQAGTLDPIVAGVLGSIVTTWATFAPCFLFVLVGAPWIEHLRGNRRLTAALSGITAAVVGVILNLAAWFAIHVVFGRVGEVHAGRIRLVVPVWHTVDWIALAIAAGAFVAMRVLRVGLLPTLGLAVVVGLLLTATGIR